jgi:hypothetical protein
MLAVGRLHGGGDPDQANHVAGRIEDGVKAVRQERDRSQRNAERELADGNREIGHENAPQNARHSAITRAATPSGGAFDHGTVITGSGQ